MASNEDYTKVFGKLDGEPDVKKIAEERDKRMKECFRRVFSTNEGRIVLHQILTDLMFYDECVDDADRVRNNYAKFMIFKRLGCDNKTQLTNLIMEIKEN